MNRRALALDVLACHRVVTVRQLDRLYGVPPRVLTGLPRITLTVAPVHMRASLLVDATFVALTEHTLSCAPLGALSHLAGTAEMQAALDVPLGAWQVLPSGRGGNRPDAEFLDTNGCDRHAVEFDSGTYSRATVQEKLASFRTGYLSTVWGVGSALRAERLRDLVPNVIQVQWWTSERRHD